MDMTFLRAFINEIKDRKCRRKLDWNQGWMKYKKWHSKEHIIHVKRMTDDRTSKKMLHTKMKIKDQEEGPDINGQTKLERIQTLEGEIGEKFKKIICGRMETAADFSVKVDPYLWKRLNNIYDLIIFILLNSYF